MKTVCVLVSADSLFTFFYLLSAAALICVCTKNTHCSTGNPH